jgi:Uma2 family endonuclease
VPCVLCVYFSVIPLSEIARFVLSSPADDGIVVVMKPPASDLRVTYRRRRGVGRGLMTTAEYFQTPETSLPTELAFGVLQVAEAPTATHQRAVGNLFLAMAPLVRERQLGEVILAPIDVVLDYDAALVVQPDLIFVSSSRHIVSDKVYGPPDLVVEVLSPHPRVGQLERRLGWLASYGVRECWLVDLSSRRFEVLTLGLSGVRSRTSFAPGVAIESGVLAGFRVPFDVFGL